MGCVPEFVAVWGFPSSSPCRELGAVVQGSERMPGCGYWQPGFLTTPHPVSICSARLLGCLGEACGAVLGRAPTCRRAPDPTAFPCNPLCSPVLSRKLTACVSASPRRERTSYAVLACMRLCCGFLRRTSRLAWLIFGQRRDAVNIP